MKKRVIGILSIICGIILASCHQQVDIYIKYPDKEVHLGVKRVLVSVDNPILSMRNESINRESDSSLFPEYDHLIPDSFNVYFIAKDGNDRGTIIKKFEKLSEGSHNVVVPARSYQVVITNYSEIEGKSEYRRSWLPEESDSIYLYGSSDIDYSQVDEGQVTVINDYAAAMVVKNDMVQSIPTMNGVSFFNTDNYYILYARDQNGGTFTRAINLKTKSKDGNVIDYNFSNSFEPNKVYRFLIQMYDQTDGNLNIIVDQDILKDTKDSVLIPNR